MHDTFHFVIFESKASDISYSMTLAGAIFITPLFFALEMAITTSNTLLIPRCRRLPILRERSSQPEASNAFAQCHHPLRSAFLRTSSHSQIFAPDLRIPFVARYLHCRSLVSNVVFCPRTYAPNRRTSEHTSANMTAHVEIERIRLASNKEIPLRNCRHASKVTRDWYLRFHPHGINATF
jgi:hypothetical protein